MKTYDELCEAAAEQSGFGIGPEYDKFLIRLVMEECAAMCDVTPPQPFRPSIEAAHAIRQSAKDLK